MALITNIIIGIPIGLLYNMIVHKICEILNDNLPYSKKIQNNLIIIISFSIIAFSVAYHSNKNKSLKYGLYFGATLLFLHSIVYNWHYMSNDTKAIISVFCFICLIWYSFSSISNTKNNNGGDDDDDNDNDNDDDNDDNDDNDDFIDDELEDSHLIKYPDTHIEKYVK